MKAKTQCIGNIGMHREVYFSEVIIQNTSYLLIVLEVHWLRIVSWLGQFVCVLGDE